MEAVDDTAMLLRRERLLSLTLALQSATGRSSTRRFIIWALARRNVEAEGDRTRSECHMKATSRDRCG